MSRRQSQSSRKAERPSNARPPPAPPSWQARLKVWAYSNPILVAILLIAILLRSANLLWGLPVTPYSNFFHPDEIKSWSSTVAFPEDYWSSTNFLYGTAVQYLLGLLLWPLKWLLVHRLGLPHDYVLLAVLVFRVASIAMGMASIYVTWQLGRLLGSERAGLIAAGLLSVAFTPALHSALTTLDVAMSFFTVVALLQMFRALQTQRLASFAVLGIICGLLLATKITGGLILAIVTAWLAWRQLLSPLLSRSHAPRGNALPGRSASLALVILLALAVFAITTPHVILRWPEYLQFMQSQKAQWYDTAPWSLSAIAQSWWRATSVCIGAPACLLAIAGLFLSGSVSKEYRLPVIACIAANYFFWLANLQARFVLPVAPLLSLLAAVACERLLTAQLPLLRHAGRLAVATAFLWSLLFTSLGIIQKAADPRPRAAQFIAEQLPAGSSIGIATDHGQEWQHHKWRYPVIDFQRYRDISFIDRPDYIVVTALELNVMRPALTSRKLLPGDRWDPAFRSDWYLGQPPPPEVFAFYRDLFAGAHYTLHASFVAPLNLPLDGACPAVFIYQRKK